MSFRSLRAGLALALALGAAGTQASTSGVVISQVYGGNGSAYVNDYVELFNGGAAPVDIAGWSVQYASATGGGNFSANGVSVLSGVLQPGQYTLVRLGPTSGTGAALPTPNIAGSTATNLAGTGGKVVLANVSTGLACNGSSTPCNATQLAQIVDLVGWGSANYFEGSVGPATTAGTALIRNAGGCADTNRNGSDFASGTPAPRTSASALAPCGGPQPIVPVCPASASAGLGVGGSVALAASDGDSLVNAAEITSTPVAGLSLGGFSAATAAGGTASVTLSIAATTAAGAYPVTVRFANGDGQTASCTVNVTVADAGPYTPTYQIQGSGSTSPLVGQGVTTRGIVTLVTNNGYFIQDETGDGDPATSDGLFVFTSSAPTVSAGRRVQVTGTVAEFDVSLSTSNPAAEARPLTELTGITATVDLGSGSITPTAVTLPLASAADFERYEGMLVTVDGPLTVSQNYFQGRYGQVTVSAGGRLRKPTNLHRPGSAQALALADLNARSTLLLDDGTSLQNPNPTPYIGADNTLRAGDTLAAITGVIDYGLATNDAGSLSLYRIQPAAPVVFTRANARPAAPSPGGGLKVASFNVLNYFTTFGNGRTASGQSGQVCTQGGSTPSASLCRGADNQAEFDRQRTKIVKAMAAIGADVFGLMEIQNNGDTAVQNLVAALNAELGGGSYAVVPPPPSTGTDAIRVAMIYKTGALSLAGASMSDGSAIHNRPPFAQAFSAGGQTFSVVVNHFKSKNCDGASGADLDQGDGQGCYNDRRKQQANALLAFIADVKAAAADDDVLVIGDLNAYAAEDPVNILVQGGLVDQVTRFDAQAYSYVFDGEAGTLDHALASPTLAAQVSGAAHWHINADEPSIIDYNTEFKAPDTGCTATCPPDLYSASAYRSSDHDPVVVGLALANPLQPQTITFNAPLDRALDSGAFTASASASSGLAVSFSGSTPAVCTVSPAGLVTLVATGTCTLTASQAGDSVHAPAAPVTRSFSVTAAPQAQSISFGAIANRPLGSAAVLLSASASSGLAVSFSSLTPSVCSVSGNSATLLAVGTCSVAANQAGDASWAAAPQVVQSFGITAAGSGNADIPTLPEWGLILLGGSLLVQGLRVQGLRRRRQRG